MPTQDSGTSQPVKLGRRLTAYRRQKAADTTGQATKSRPMAELLNLQTVCHNGDRFSVILLDNCQH
jgi:hypothetical protein